MGLCLSKKKKPNSNPPPSSLPIPNEKKVEKEKPIKAVVAAKLASEVVATTKKNPLFAIAIAPEKKEKKKAETPTNGNDNGHGGGVAMVEEPSLAPFRASSCTKEEVDAILIQCGRLSHSSSGREGGSGHRRRSSSKRSFDFDNEKKGEEEDREKPVSRPSPHRRTPGRERSIEREHKHSRSRERGSGGGRRASQSPAKRSDGQVSSEKPKQPVKMVAVPAREKGSSRRASPRSRSPSNTCKILDENSQHCPPPQLPGQGSARKGARSPYRRNPMTEVDENIVRGNQLGGGSNCSKLQRTKEAKLSQSQAQKEKEKESIVLIPAVEIEQQVKCIAKKQEMESEIMEEAKESLNPSTITRTRSFRRSSRDFDQIVGQNQDSTLGKVSLTPLMLGDIQNPVTFTLPACVSKACSILEAVADLNSSSSSSSFSSGKKSFEFNTKYITVRDKGGDTVDSQESWGCKSLLGQDWSSSSELSSVDSVDRRQTLHSNYGEEGDCFLNGKKRGFDHQCQLRIGSGTNLSLPVLASGAGAGAS